MRRCACSVGIYPRKDRRNRATARLAEHVGATLGCIVEAARKEAIATAFCIATDATGVAVQPTRLEGKRQACRKGHFFVSLADKDHVFLDFQPKHTSLTVWEMFKGFRGYVQADARAIYDALFKGLPPDGADEKAGECVIKALPYGRATATSSSRPSIGVPPARASTRARSSASWVPSRSPRRSRRPRKSSFRRTDALPFTHATMHRVAPLRQNASPCSGSAVLSDAVAMAPRPAPGGVRKRASTRAPRMP